MSFDPYPVIRRALFALDPERAHALMLSALSWAHSLRLLRSASGPGAGVSLMGLQFPNRIGLAAGFDKSGRYVDALGSLGFGFLEVGTVTPRPQAGQPRPRLFRLPSASALINRMGFPNDGVAQVVARLSQRIFPGVCGVNIGKNAATPLDAAAADYVECFRVAAPVADYIAVNVSSPNTKNLRQLQHADLLRPVLDALLAEQRRFHEVKERRIPLLLKIAPDLPVEELSAVAEVIHAAGLDGVIATNSTLRRSSVVGMRFADEEGGLSGVPLRRLMMEAVRTLRASLPSSVCIVAVGGIDTAEAARHAFDAGADLIQVYTGLIYRGPGLIAELAKAASGLPGSM